MQTFMPYSDFGLSARVLDNKRLNKQRIEVLQLLNALLGVKKSAWINHPAAKMWKGYEGVLVAYGISVCLEWKLRGFKDTCQDKILVLFRRFKLRESLLPPWLGEEDFHASHRSNLLRKDPKHYGQFGWKEPNNLPYVWPV
jgi:hypothetical protein